MVLEQEAGGYGLGRMVRLYGSFKVAAGAVSVLRDARSKCIGSVTWVSTGLYEVTFDAGFPIPEREVFIRAGKSAASATPAKACIVEYVEGTYNMSTRKFRLVSTIVADTALAAYTDPAVGDGDNNCRIQFELLGSITSSGTDPA